MVDLSIIIVSWNVWPLLRACLRSLEAGSRRAVEQPATARAFGPDESAGTLEVIVVDNASEDGTAAALAAEFPWVRLLAAGENLGFTAGNNRGYAEAGGRFIYFLNPDTELLPAGDEGQGLWALYAAVQADSSVGLAGPQLIYADGSVQSSRRRFPARLTGFVESTWLGRLWPGNPWARRLHMDDWHAPFAHNVDWVVGAAMLARREALEQVRPAGQQGPFDEGFFMYSEELDLCRRLHQAGWRVRYVPGAQVRHHEGRSSEQVTAARHIHFNTSKVRYYRQVFGVRWAEALRRYLLLEFRVQLWIERAKWLVGHRRGLRKERIGAYRQVIASGLRG